MDDWRVVFADGLSGLGVDLHPARDGASICLCADAGQWLADLSIDPPSRLARAGLARAMEIGDCGQFASVVERRCKSPVVPAIGHLE